MGIWYLNHTYYRFHICAAEAKRENGYRSINLFLLFPSSKNAFGFGSGFESAIHGVQPYAICQQFLGKEE